MTRPVAYSARPSTVPESTAVLLTRDWSLTVPPPDRHQPPRRSASAPISRSGTVVASSSGYDMSGRVSAGSVPRRGSVSGTRPLAALRREAVDDLPNGDDEEKLADQCLDDCERLSGIGGRHQVAVADGCHGHEAEE